MEAVQVDGNNVLEVYDTVKRLAESIRKNPRPVLLELITFRMRGHEEASGTKYVPKELFDEWGKKDPVLNFELFLIEQKVLNSEGVQRMREEIRQYIDEELKIGFSAKPMIVDEEEELKDVYAKP